MTKAPIPANADARPHSSRRQLLRGIAISPIATAAGAAAGASFLRALETDPAFAAMAASLLVRLGGGGLVGGPASAASAAGGCAMPLGAPSSAAGAWAPSSCHRR